MTDLAGTADRGAPATLPSVTVVMPVRNEEGYIEAGVAAVLAQDYPEALLDVIVADGRSTDATRTILERLAGANPRVTVIDNPEGIVPTGLNRAIRAATSDIVVRVDGHCEISADFIRSAVAVLEEHPEAWAVGGPVVNAARTPFGRAAAWAMSSRAGVGGASHRFEGYEGYSDSVAFPAFRREVFDTVGWFDEALVRNQDDEFNFRLTQAGGKVFVSPRIRYRYFVRETPRQLFRQYYQYAFWRIPMVRKHKRPTTLRQLAPPIFFVTMAIVSGAGLASRRPVVAGGLPSAYAVGLGAVGVQSLRDLDRAAAARVPLAVAILHTSYAGGWLVGGWSTVFRPKAWTPGGKASTLSR